MTLSPHTKRLPLWFAAKMGGVYAFYYVGRRRFPATVFGRFRVCPCRMRGLRAFSLQKEYVG